MTESYSYKINPVDEAYKFYERHRKHITKFAHELEKKHKTITAPEIENQAFIILVRLAKSYNPSKRCSINSWLYTYLKRSVERWITMTKDLVSYPDYICQKKEHFKDRYIFISEPQNTSGVHHDNDMSFEETYFYGLNNVQFQDIDSETLSKAVRKLIDRLPELQRYVICSYYGIGIEQKTVGQLAMERGVSQQAIRHILSRGKKRLLNIINNNPYNKKVIGELLDYEI